MFCKDKEKSLSFVVESVKKRLKRNQQKQNGKKRLQSYNFNLSSKNGTNSKLNVSSAGQSSSVSQVNSTNHQNESKTISSNFKVIIIDGNNVGMAHGLKTFSAIGLKLAVNFFIDRGHKDVKILVPRYRRFESKEYQIFDELESKGFLCFTPSRYLNGKLIVPYDDRFILEAAEYFNAIIVSNDNFCDIKEEKPQWKCIVEKNLLQFVFVGDLFLVASDPMGKNGPTLDQFLSKEQKIKCT